MKKQYINIMRLIQFILIFFIPLVKNFSVEDLNSPRLFEDEICSYNGVPDEILSSSNWVNCTCYDEYTDDPSEVRYINGVPVQYFYLYFYHSVQIIYI
jgi:hypothetical protein